MRLWVLNNVCNDKLKKCFISLNIHSITGGVAGYTLAGYIGGTVGKILEKVGCSVYCKKYSQPKPGK